MSDKQLLYYHMGYKKGLEDARRGISFKLLSHFSELCYDLLRAWERGYTDGYCAFTTDGQGFKKAS